MSCRNDQAVASSAGDTWRHVGTAMLLTPGLALAEHCATPGASPRRLRALRSRMAGHGADDGTNPCLVSEALALPGIL
jgi:hypothetical protein